MRLNKIDILYLSIIGIALLVFISIVFSDSELEIIAGSYYIHRQSEAYSEILPGIPNDFDSLSIYDYVKTVIYPTVEQYKTDDKFILVKQKVNEEMYKSHLIWNLELFFSNKESKQIADSLIANDPFFIKVFSNSVNYYIIDVEENVIHGPFKKNEFKLKKND